ncbi:MAG: DegT/DnrJ/EryC1/StrS aminotransferase family protein [Gemmataceae bacterium]|nr:DegT/DnrJ/EryC1/StrS aminotransferase family protein [Gemmataceae bacterium]
MTGAHPTPATRLNWPLMKNNIAREDLNAVIDLLQQDDPVLTQSKHVRAFEEEWSRWLGVKHSVFVNSGSSANLVTLAALKELYPDGGEVIVPPLTWVSDIAAVLHCGFTPVFADIDERTLGMDTEQILARATVRTRAVFLTHVLGFNGLTARLVEELKARRISLIEDVCESHGATFNEQKLGAFGWASNFSFYYAHHLSTIEGGMVCTDDESLYEVVRMMRSHGLVRELRSDGRRFDYIDEFPDLNPEFIFAFPAYNVRSTEINAVIGRSQLRRLDDNNHRRTQNFMLFLRNLDPDLYRTDFRTEGSCNYAFTLILNQPDHALCARVMRTLRESEVEFRRGTAGGGNQLRQPYLRRLLGPDAWKQCPKADHVHFFGFYIGNYPTLDEDHILRLWDLLNGLK